MPLQAVHLQHCVADYQLLVYGSKTHDAMYCKMCEELIVELELQDSVKIMGLGKPTQILPTGWVYLQVTLHRSESHVIHVSSSCHGPATLLTLTHK